LHGARAPAHTSEDGSHPRSVCHPARSWVRFRVLVRLRMFLVADDVSAQHAHCGTVLLSQNGRRLRLSTDWENHANSWDLKCRCNSSRALLASVLTRIVQIDEAHGGNQTRRRTNSRRLARVRHTRTEYPRAFAHWDALVGLSMGRRVPSACVVPVPTQTVLT
jgi:hypothetical protein